MCFTTFLTFSDEDGTDDLPNVRPGKVYGDDVLADDESSSYVESADEDDVDEL